MFANIGESERKLRIITGVLLLGIGFAAPIPDQWHALSTVTAVGLLLSAALGFCPFKAVALRRLS